MRYNGDTIKNKNLKIIADEIKKIWIQKKEVNLPENGPLEKIDCSDESISVYDSIQEPLFEIDHIVNMLRNSDKKERKIQKIFK